MRIACVLLEVALGLFALSLIPHYWPKVGAFALILAFVGGLAFYCAASIWRMK